MLKKNYLLIILGLFLVVSCKKKSGLDADMNFPEAIAKVVSNVTSGNIKSNQLLEVEFVNTIVPYEALNKDLGNDIIEIYPETEGTLKWITSKKLVFEPKDRWKLRQHYSVKIDLNKLSEDFLSDDLGELKFRFYVEGREIVKFDGSPELKERNDPRIVQYLGKVIFSEETSLEDVQKSISLKQGFKTHEITVIPENDNRTFAFISDDLVRDNRSRNYTFRISKSKLELSSEYRDDFEIPAIEDMKVSRVVLEEQGRHPRIKLIFSDDIEADQDISGYFQISPEMDVKVSKIGNSVVLDGPFKFGGSYTITVEQGIKSRWATAMDRKYVEKIQFSNLAPQLEFASEGFILPSANKQKIQFTSSNISRVHLEIKKVNDKNIPRFVRREQLSSDKNRAIDFNQNSYSGAVGVIVFNKTLELGTTKNEWLLSEIDLSHVFKDFDQGLYLIRLNFNPNDILEGLTEDKLDYIEKNGQIYKPVIISDIGLTVKHAGDDMYVYTSDLITGKPMGNVRVKLYRYWDDDPDNTTITRNNGMARFSSDYYPSFVIAEANDQLTIVKMDEMEWNTSGFDVSGEAEDSEGIRAFTYTERGVYRPGDEINLSLIVRNKENTFSTNSPVTLRFYNPENQLIIEQTNTSAKDGFYTFNFKTKESAPTGEWYANLDVGARIFTHYIKIETVVPNKLKVRLNSDQEKINASDKSVKFDIQGNYLFGNPASQLNAEAEIEFFPKTLVFPKYESYSFSNDYIRFTPFNRKIFTGKLDTSGKASVTYNIPSFENVSSALTARISATVFDKGGRPNNGWLYIPVHTYPYYVGVKKSQYGYNYVQTGKQTSISVIAVDPEGNPASGKTIRYRIYQNNSYWWYQYDSRREYRLRFKSDNSTVLVKEGKVVSGTDPVSIKFTPNEDGDYLIEIQEGGYDGHTVTSFMYAYPWGDIPSGDKNAGTLSLRSNKEKYTVGETANIICPVPKEGSILLTVERGNDILKSEWVNNPGEGELIYKLPITTAMLPNSYVTVSILQPHEQSVNDRPIRMFGILPLLVEDPDTRHAIKIEMPDELKPKQDFKINISTDDGNSSQFTIAVVDEGLLDLTNFRTPDPWKNFFKKIRLQVRTYDIFSNVIGANKGDVFKTFSIGGDMDYREAEMGPKKGKRRFKPVCLFKGPITTDDNGRAAVTFKMPDYNGSVRVMVISARKNSYAHAEKTVPVKSDLIIQPTLPRVLGPGESFQMPVNVFAMKDDLGEVVVTVESQGPVMVGQESKKLLKFQKAADQDIHFNMNTKNAVGQAKVVVTAKAQSITVNTEIDIMVQPKANRVYDASEAEITAGNSLRLEVPKIGMDGTNNAKLSIQVFPNMDFGHRLSWLIRYPYGCIEQTTSSVFPQLYLKDVLSDDTYSENEIDKNINAGIDRLRMFQTSEGGFSYWPGNNSVSNWGTNYAAHFLIEAKKAGYHVPDYMFDKMIRYMERQARYKTGDIITRVNRVFVLALEGKTASSELNLLYENELKSMNDVQKHMFATAMYLAGRKSTASKIIAGAGKNVEDYKEFSGSYGSGLRDMAIILNCYVTRGEKDDAQLIAKDIASKLSNKMWYSTQTVGYSLLALGKYFDMIGLSGIGNQRYLGYVQFPDGTKKQFDSRKPYSLNLEKAIGNEITIFFDPGSSMEKAYASITWNGVPLTNQAEASSKNLGLEVKWYDESGNSINPSKLKQGDTFYGHYRVNNISPVLTVEEVALVQILPSGWEIENTRLAGTSFPDWTSGYKTGSEEYLDIRDDRIMWFFDIKKNYPLDFIVKINAVSAGEFYLPGAKVEAMYNNDYRAVGEDMNVVVKGF